MNQGNWTNILPSTSFKIQTPSNVAATSSTNQTKHPFTSSFPGQLKWHNTIAQDFASTSGHKRSSSSAFAEQDYLDFQPGQSVSMQPLPSPTKKQKISTTESCTPSPAYKNTSYTAQDMPDPSYIQTPPPSAPATRKRNKHAKRMNNDGHDTVSREETQSVVGHEDTAVNIHSSFVQSVRTNLAHDHYYTPSFNITQTQPSHIVSGSAWDPVNTRAIAQDTLPTTSSGLQNIDISDIVPSSFAAFDWSVLSTGNDQDVLNFSFMDDPSQAELPPPVVLDSNYLLSSNQLVGAGHGLDAPYMSSQPLQNIQYEAQLAEFSEVVREEPALPQASVVHSRPSTSHNSEKPRLKRSKSETILATLDGRTKPVKSKNKNASQRKKSHIHIPGNDENITPSPPTTCTMVRSSPSRESAGQSKSKLRTLVNFSVSPGGRAKAEAITVCDPESDFETVHHDHEAVWSSCESDSSTDSNESDYEPSSLYASRKSRKGKYVTSAQNSFCVAKSPRKPKLARFNTSLATINHHHHHHYHPASTKHHGKRKCMTQRSSPIMQTSPILPHYPREPFFDLTPSKRLSSRSRRKSMPSFGSTKVSKSVPSVYSMGSMHDDDDEASEAETVVDDYRDHGGDAIQALRKVVHRRYSMGKYAQPNLHADVSVHSHVNTRPTTSSSASISAASEYQFNRPFFSDQLYTTPFKNNFDSFADTISISPSTIAATSFSTPSNTLSTPSKADPREMRCPCGYIDGDENILQCDACNYWVHIRCEGLQGHALPKVYMCSLCTRGQANILGRLDTGKKLHNRKKTAQHSSPLANKESRTYHTN